MTTHPMVDTHCHLDVRQFKGDIDAVVENAKAAGVTRIIIPAIELETIAGLLKVAERYEGVFAAVGIHPNSSKAFDPSMINTLRDYAKHPKVVAIGEIGLDYHWDLSPKPTQHTAFKAQLALAKELELPVIIHNREADTDTVGILVDYAKDLPEKIKQRVGVLHSVSAPYMLAMRAVNAGFFLGFTGPLTYSKADDMRKIAHDIPQDRMLVETDAPYLTPEPYRGKRNEPAYIPYIVKRLALVRGISAEVTADLTTANAQRLFELP
jgi:TatD DNase family protein